MSAVSGIRIVLLGKNKKNKRRICKLINTQGSQKTSSHHGRWRGKPLTVVTTPNIFGLSVEKVREEMKKSVSECSPGPNVLLLLVNPSDFTEWNRQILKIILKLFGPEASKHSMVIMTHKNEEINPSVDELVKDCGGRQCNMVEGDHTSLMKVMENIVRENKENFLTFSEDWFKTLNLVLCGRSRAVTSSAAKAILGPTAFGSVSNSSECVKYQAQVCGRSVSLVELPALHGKPEEAAMEESLRCISLCNPEGVHGFILVLPLGPLTDEDKEGETASSICDIGEELETIQKTLGSGVTDFTTILFTTDLDPEAAPVVHFVRENEDVQKLCQSCGGGYVVLNIKDKHQIPGLMDSLDKRRQRQDKPWSYTTEIFAQAQIQKIIQQEKKITTQSLVSCDDEEKNPERLRIVLIGKTGSGKSSSGNTIIGGKEFKAESSQTSVTKLCQKVQSEVDGRQVTVVDTPGLFDTTLSREQVNDEMVKCISLLAPGPHVFLLVVKVTDRFTEEEKETLKLIKEAFGKNAEKFTIVLLTGGDSLEHDNQSIEEYIENKCDESFKKLINDCGGRYYLFNNHDEQNHKQVSDLISKIERMVKENGGSYYTNEMLQEAEAAIKKEMERILKGKEEEMKREREELQGKHEEEMEQMKRKMEEQREETEKERKLKEQQLEEMKENVEKEHQERKKEQEQRHEEDRKKKEEEETERQRWEQTVEDLEKRIKSESESKKEEMKREREELQRKHEEEMEEMKGKVEKHREETEKERKLKEQQLEQMMENINREQQERKKEQEERDEEKRKKKEEEETERQRWEQKVEALEQKAESKETIGRKLEEEREEMKKERENWERKQREWWKQRSQEDEKRKQQEREKIEKLRKEYDQERENYEKKREEEERIRREQEEKDKKDMEKYKKALDQRIKSEAEYKERTMRKLEEGREEMRKKQEDWERKQREWWEQRSQEDVKRQEEQRKKIKKLQEEYEKERENYKKQREEEDRIRREQEEKEKKDTEKRHETALENLKKTYEEEARKKAEEFNEFREKYNRKLAEQEEAHKRREDKMETEHRKEKEEMEKEHQKKEEELTKKKEEMEREYQREMEEHKKKKEEMEREHQKKLKEHQNLLEKLKEHQEMEEEKEKEHQKKEEEQKKKEEEMVKEHQREVEEHKKKKEEMEREHQIKLKEHQKNLLEKEEEHKKEKEKMEKEHQNKEEEYKKQMTDNGKKYDLLKAAYSMKQNLKEKNERDICELVRRVTNNRDLEKKIKKLLKTQEEEMKTAKTEQQKKNMEQKHKQQTCSMLDEVVKEAKKSWCVIL